MSDELIPGESESATRGQSYADRLKPIQAQWFTTTHWSVVLSAGQADSAENAEALNNLCRTYWYPLYAYIRRKNFSPEDAQDITQAFLASFLEKDRFAKADKQKGKFRSFLVASLENFMKDWRKHEHAQKRGGGQPVVSIDEASAEERYRIEPADYRHPGEAYDRDCMMATLALALSRLKAGFEAEGRPQRFELLKPFLLAEEDVDYEDVARRLGTSVGPHEPPCPACAVDSVKFLRKRFHARWQRQMRFVPRLITC